MEKACFKCGRTKPLSEFYKHARMADGHVNKCKECNKADVSANYRANRQYYQAYDSLRHCDQKRKLDKLRYQKTARELNPEKFAARRAVNNAKRSGLIIEQPCEICGTMEKIEAHHDDYSKPLSVRWLCMWHHKEHHSREERNPP